MVGWKYDFEVGNLMFSIEIQLLQNYRNVVATGLATESPHMRKKFATGVATGRQKCPSPQMSTTEIQPRTRITPEPIYETYQRIQQKF